MEEIEFIKSSHVRQLKEIQSHLIQNGMIKPTKIKALNLLIAIHIESTEQLTLNLF